VSSATAEGQESQESGRFLLTVNFVFLSTVMAYGLGFLAVILVSRALGADGRGVTAIYQSAVNLTFVCLSLGIGSAIVYYVSRGDLGGRKALEAGLTMTLLAAALVALGVLIGDLILEDGVKFDGVPYWLAIIAVPGLLQFQLFETLLRGQGRFGAMNVLNVALPVCVLVAFIGVELTAGLTVTRAVYAWSFAFWPPVLCGYLIVGPSLWPRGITGPRELKPLLVFGAQSQAGNLIQLLNYRLDTYIIAFLTSTTGVGLYATGVSLSEGLWFIANSAAVVLLTNLTAGDDEYVARMTPLVCRSTLLITTLAALGAAVVSPFVIPLVFGSSFDDAVIPFLCLLPGTVALSGGKILSAYVFSRGKPTINAVIAVITLMVTVGGDFILIPWLGVTGAAIGATIAYTVSLTLTTLAYRRLSGASIAQALLPQPADAGIALEAVRGIAGRFAAR
jgi:O-antigen/teichoic acid export membrane protein